jgi:hypothetical protein
MSRNGNSVVNNKKSAFESLGATAAEPKNFRMANNSAI